MLKIIITLMITLSLIIPVNALSQNNDATRIIVSGKGIVKTKADLSYINIAIEQTEKTASQAQTEAANTMKNVLSALKNTGIPKDKIQTTSFRLNPRYKYEKGQRNLIGYTATNQVRITLSDLGRVGKIIDTAIAAGANSVNNVIFTVEDDAPHKRTALKKAFNNAKEKAKSIAAAAGLTLKKVVNISESGAQVIPPNLGIRTMKAEGVANTGATPIVPGKVEIKGSLTVVYECVK
jgi:uncharacterized protein